MLDILYSKFCAATMTPMQSQKEGCMRAHKRRTKRVQEFLPVFAFEGDDFAASTSNIGVYVKRLPEMINGARTGHGTNVKKDADVGLENGTKGVEEPTMRIDLFLVNLFQAKDDLHRDNTLLGAFNLVRWSDGD